LTIWWLQGVVGLGTQEVRVVVLVVIEHPQERQVVVHLLKTL
jgi:hypothetical protein